MIGGDVVKRPAESMSDQPPLLWDQRKIDADQLQLLAIFHFVLAGLALAGIGFLALHFAVMRCLVVNPNLGAQSKAGLLPTELWPIFQWLYVVLGGLLLAGGVATCCRACGFASGNGVDSRWWWPGSIAFRYPSVRPWVF